MIASPAAMKGNRDMRRFLVGRRCVGDQFHSLPIKRKDPREQDDEFESNDDTQEY